MQCVAMMMIMCAIMRCFIDILSGVGDGMLCNIINLADLSTHPLC